MNENLAYWQLDFTVVSQANLAPDCMVMQEKSKSFWGPRRPPNPRPTLLLVLRPSARGLLQPSTIFRYFLQSLVSSLLYRFKIMVFKYDIWAELSCRKNHENHLHNIKATSTFILRYNALIQTLQRSPNHE